MNEDQTGVTPQETDVTTLPSGEPEGDVDAGQVEAGEPKETLSEKEQALIKARDENARKAREAEQRRIEAEERARIYQEQLKPQQEEDDLGIDPDMPLTLADLQKIEEAKQKKEQQRRQQDYEKAKQAKINKSLAKAQDKYKDSEYNIDWIENYVQTHPDKYTPEALAAIGAMPDPVETLYRLVMSEDENRDKISAIDRQQTVKETIDTINKNLNSPGTLSNIGGGDKVMDSIKQMDKMSSTDFVKYADSIIKKKA